MSTFCPFENLYTLKYDEKQHRTPSRIFVCLARANFQVKETSSLHLLFGLPERGVRWALGYQMFGFREPALGPASPSRGRVRLSGFGHVGLGGSLALCDPASGLAFAMVTNKVGAGWLWLVSPNVGNQGCRIAVCRVGRLMCHTFGGVSACFLAPLPVALWCEARAGGT